MESSILRGVNTGLQVASGSPDAITTIVATAGKAAGGIRQEGFMTLRVSADSLHTATGASCRLPCHAIISRLMRIIEA